MDSFLDSPMGAGIALVAVLGLTLIAVMTVVRSSRGADRRGSSGSDSGVYYGPGDTGDRDSNSHHGGSHHHGGNDGGSHHGGSDGGGWGGGSDGGGGDSGGGGGDGGGGGGGD